MHKSSRVTISGGGSGSSFDRNDPTEVKFAKLRYFWEEIIANEDSVAGSLMNIKKDVTLNTLHGYRNITTEKVVIKLCKKLKCI